MGQRSIRMPDVGEGVAEAEIVEWSVKVGDLVREDQVVAAVMTDKATVEIPTPVAGTVVALGGGVGDVLAVGAELAAQVMERCFYALEAPIQRVAGWDTPYPHAEEWDYFPGPARVGRALVKAMEA